MTDLRKAAEQAAKELKELIHWHGIRYSNDKLVPAHRQTPEIKSAMKTLKELRQALAQPEQEPECVATIGNWGKVQWREDVFPQLGAKLYSTPPKREWVGLTRDEVLDIEETTKHPLAFYGAIEAKLKEKNT